MIAEPGSAEELVLHYLQRLKLQQFLDEQGVEDVAVQPIAEVDEQQKIKWGPPVAWVRRGAWQRYDIPELNQQLLEYLSVVAGSLRQQEHGAHKPILDTDLPGGERLNVVARPHVPHGRALTIRRHEDKVAPLHTIRERYVTDGWNKYAERTGKDNLGHLLAIYDSGDEKEFVRACVQARQNIVLAGHTGSSKTTLLKTILSAIDDSKRIITIEDALEIALRQPNSVRLLFKRDDLAEKNIGAEILAQAALRAHPDIVILGEMRGREAWTFVRDVIPPHPGSVIGLHANTPGSALRRIIGLCKGDPAAASYDDLALARLVAGVVDVIIPLEQMSDKKFHWHPVWFKADAKRHDKTALDLLEEE